MFVERLGFGRLFGDNVVYGFCWHLRVQAKSKSEKYLCSLWDLSIDDKWNNKSREFMLKVDITIRERIKFGIFFDCKSGFWYIGLENFYIELILAPVANSIVKLLFSPL